MTNPPASKTSAPFALRAAEPAAWLLLCAAFVFAMSQGHSNGFGVFRQPRDTITVPLIVGGVINAWTFWVHAFVALPKLLEKRWRAYVVATGAIAAANLVAQTLTQEAIIELMEPALRGAPLSRLVRENAYMLPFLLPASALYRLARDRVKSLLAPSASPSSSGGEFLHFGGERERLQLPAREVKYIAAAGNYVEVATASGRRLVYGALGAIARDLPQDRFARIHRSYVVGLEHVTAVRADAVEIGQQTLPIGSSYRKAFKELWARRRVGP